MKQSKTILIFYQILFLPYLTLAGVPGVARKSQYFMLDVLKNDSLLVGGCGNVQTRAQDPGPKIFFSDPV